MNLFHCILFGFALFCMISCSEPMAGNSMETENSISMQAVNYAGGPMSNAKVLVRPAWFVADSSKTLAHTNDFIRNETTDKYGWVEIKGLPEGKYTIEIRSDSLSAFVDIDHRDTTVEETFSELVLGLTGTLKGQITLPADSKKAWVQIYGLDYTVSTDSTGIFCFKALPSGVVRVRSIAEGYGSILAEDLSDVYATRIVDMGVIGLPGIGAEDPATWQYTTSFPVDSLVSDWMLPLYDSTVLTIRLNENNFNFSEADDNGLDLRVETENGVHLPYERVRWDAALERAVIRVRVSETLASDSSLLVLRWGHANAIDRAVSSVWEGIPDSVEEILNSVWVDDFEDSNDVTGFPDPIPVCHWYIGNSDSVTISPTSEEGLQKALETDTTGRGGIVAHLSYVSEGIGWALLGTTIGGHKSLATLDSIVFWARGNGTLSLAFDKLKTATEGKAWIHFTLDSAWTRHSVKPANFLDADGVGGNVGWDAVKDSVSNITFLGSDGTDFWIDDVHLYGVNRDDLK
jgi:hypothetical protein